MFGSRDGLRSRILSRDRGVPLPSQPRDYNFWRKITESNHHHIATAGWFSRPVAYRYALSSIGYHKILAEAKEIWEYSFSLYDLGPYSLAFRHFSPIEVYVLVFAALLLSQILYLFRRYLS